MSKKRPWTQEEMDYVRQQVEAGVISAYEIGRAIGRGKMTIYHMMERMGIKFAARPKRVWTPERCKHLMLLWSTNMSLHEIADEIGLTPTAIERQASEMGLPRRSEALVRGPYEPKDTVRMIGEWPALPADAFKDIKLKSDPAVQLSKPQDRTLAGIGSAML